MWRGFVEASSQLASIAVVSVWRVRSSRHSPSLFAHRIEVYWPAATRCQFEKRRKISLPHPDRAANVVSQKSMISTRSHGPPWECRPRRSASSFPEPKGASRACKTAFPRRTVGTSSGTDFGFTPIVCAAERQCWMEDLCEPCISTRRRPGRDVHRPRARPLATQETTQSEAVKTAKRPSIYDSKLDAREQIKTATACSRAATTSAS